ncbi:MAG: Ig-like domain-containing protein [Myxococcota bacterium]
MGLGATRALWALTVAGSVGFVLGCSGWFQPDSSDVEQEIDALQGSTVQTSDSTLPTLVFDGGGAGAPDFDEGDGVQILHAAPYGPEAKAIQVAVVFDRPMVALTDLDTMTGDVPLSCAPDAGAKARWAGSSTAVLIPPEGGFPRSTRFECSVPAGTTAVDGVALEKGVSWWFETPRVHVAETTPRAGADDVDPASPIELVFDQPVDPQVVAKHLTLRSGRDGEVAVEVSRPDGGSDQRVQVTGKLTKDTSYTLQIDDGVTGTEGPLPAGQSYSLEFRTYPPFQLLSHEPTDEVSPASPLRLSFATRVPRDSVAEHLSITPAAKGFSPATGEWSWTDYGFGMSSPRAPSTR